MKILFLIIGTILIAIGFAGICVYVKIKEIQMFNEYIEFRNSLIPNNFYKFK